MFLWWDRCTVSGGETPASGVTEHGFDFIGSPVVISANDLDVEMVVHGVERVGSEFRWHAVDVATWRNRYQP